MLSTEEKIMKEHSVIPYKILYHERGYIRLEVPSLKKLSWSFLFMNCRETTPFPVPSGIKDFHVNPLKGSIVITYEPDDIDILKYIRKIASDPEIKRMIKG
jgi:hypothetical protein